MAGRQRAARKTIRSVAAQDRRFVEEIRACCLTNIRRPHAAECRRAYRQCGDKIAWATRQKAMEAANRGEAVDGKAWNAYRCRFCHRWHSGHAREEAS